MKFIMVGVVRDGLFLTRCAGSASDQASDLSGDLAGKPSLQLKPRVRFPGRATKSRGNIAYAEQKNCEFDSQTRQRSCVET